MMKEYHKKAVVYTIDVGVQPAWNTVLFRLIRTSRVTGTIDLYEMSHLSCDPRPLSETIFRKWVQIWEFKVHFFPHRTKGAGSRQIWQVSETKNSDRGVTGHTPVRIIRNSTVPLLEAT
jgi:hypothetical protein